ncbi:hypothetical protein [Formosa sp. PL04]|uniref:hypothetical protein n=1 Tax=Formosa sp. PL04 TaxID=3081755 RepID=UPI00298202B9|nr:hypothetical protein [Formosa sp. PL04]MDW5288871.1 hypothetical protein [Formosa sp. PL04]
MKPRTPLDKELELIGESEGYKIIYLDNYDYLAKGVCVNNINHIFAKPIDVSDDIDNVLDDGEPQFKVAFLSEEMCELLKSILHSNLSIKINRTGNYMYLKTNLISLQLIFKVDYMVDYMIMCVEKCTQVEEDLIEIYNGTLTSVSLLSKKYEAKIPTLNKDITTRVTVEIALHLNIDNKAVVLGMPTPNIDGDEPIEIYDESDDILDFVNLHQIKKSREINE